MSSNTIPKKKLILWLLLIWIIGLMIDRLWFSLDNSVPSWDPADYLNGVMRYHKALENLDLLNSSWWRNFWVLSSKIPPLIYIITGASFHILPPGLSSANLVFSGFSLLLIVSLFFLGKLFFNEKIALLTCVLIQLIPGLYYYRREFLLDYPLAVIITISFTCLSYWYFAKGKSSWWLSLLTGISIGLGLLLKQPFLFFLFFPLLFAFISSIWQKKWQKVSQIILMLFSAVIIFYPWYRTNWLVIFTSGKRATIDSAIIEGDPGLNTLKAWTFYAEVSPYLLSSFLLLISLFSIIYLLIKYFRSSSMKSKGIALYLQNNFYQKSTNQKNIINITIWLIIFIIGGYLLSSLNINKDSRYILPLLPVISLIISALIFSYQGQKNNLFKISTVAIAFVLMLLNLFPLGGTFLTDKLSPKMENYPYTGEQWPVPKVIDTAIKTNPYLRMNIGVLPSTSKINQSNISFYGSIPNFQVYGRQVGVSEKEVPQDVNALDWFLTKTGDQGSIPDAQTMTVELVRNSGKFNLLEKWLLPDESYLQLYQRNTLQNTVFPLATSNSNIKLDNVIFSANISQGQAVDISYDWSGSAQQLQNAIVLLNWYSEEDKSKKWTHDHALAMSNLHFNNLKNEELNQDFQVIENTAMFVPENIPDGNYILEATYLDNLIGETTPLTIPKTQITIDHTITSSVAQRELDLVSEINRLAPALGEGIEGLDPVFATIGRINQYDPTQAYLKVTEKALQYRLQREKNLDYLYTLLLSQVLQEKVYDSIATAQKLVELDPDNPYNHAYLSFLHLYDWDGKKGQKALQPALQLAPEVIEFKYLEGISALLQGNLFKVWEIAQELI